MADTDKLYKLRKQLRQLESYRGSGTELISVYIPAGSAVHEMGNKLREEMSQASNIKSKSTKTSVLGALERIMNYLKMFKKTPPNGLAVFCGNVSDNPAKVDIQLFSLEPPEPLNIGAYRCDSRFFLEPLQQLMETKDVYGIVVMDGREATLATVKGTNINVVKKMASMAHAKVRKGGQCLAAGTLLVQGNGGIIDIENFKARNKTVGVDFQTSKTQPAFASDFFVTPAKHSIIIKTKNPLGEIHATPYHRFFVISEYGIKEKFAKDLDKTDRILIAKRINTEGSQIKTGFRTDMRIILNQKERGKLRRARIRLGLSQKKAAEMVGLSQMVISDLETGEQTPTNENLRRIYGLYDLVLDEKRLSKKTLKFPEYWNGNLARLFGIICGDGSEDGNRIIIYEGSEELVKDYCSLVERTIGVKPTVRVVDKRGQKGSFAKKKYFEVRIHSLEFVKAIKQIAPEIISRERDIPNDILKCENRIVAAFLSGLYDAEGYLDRNNVDIAMVDEKLMKKIQLILLRFGILSSFAEKSVQGNPQWSVRITDLNATRSFKRDVGFRRKDKRKRLEKLCKRGQAQQYVDQIPLDGREVSRLAKEIGLRTSDFHAASYFFRNKKPLGREAFYKKIVPVFEKHKDSKRGREILDYLDRMYQSDYTCASIKEKTPVENKENFYDITVPVHSNFIANGFVVHNSQRRYQRLVEEQIETYYKRVGEAMDKAFLDRVKGVMVGGPGPTKEFFMKAKPFNYQIKVLGVVDTGYTDEYGVREVLSKSESILAKQEAVKEKTLVDRFIKEAVSEGLATYGANEVREAILSRQAERVLLSEGLEHITATYKCSSCKAEEKKVHKGKPEESIPCKACDGQMKLVDRELLIDELADLAKENNIEVEIVSTDTVEGAQFLTGFGGVGAFLRYKSR